MTTPGVPENVNPATSYGQDASTVRQCSPIWYQMLGMAGARCGSLASRGRPLSVNRPETTQLFDPMPSPVPIRVGTASRARWASSSARPPAGSAAAACSPAGITDGADAGPDAG